MEIQAIIKDNLKAFLKLKFQNTNFMIFLQLKKQTTKLT